MNVDLEKLAALSAAATKGPWEHEGQDVRVHYVHHSHRMAFASTPQNSALIAAMRNNIDALLSELRSARTELAQLRTECLAAREWLRQEQISSGLVSDVRACAGGEINQACEAYRKLVAGGET